MSLATDSATATQIRKDMLDNGTNDTIIANPPLHSLLFEPLRPLQHLHAFEKRSFLQRLFRPVSTSSISKTSRAVPSQAESKQTCRSHIYERRQLDQRSEAFTTRFGKEIRAQRLCFPDPAPHKQQIRTEPSTSSFTGTLESEPLNTSNVYLSPALQLPATSLPMAGGIEKRGTSPAYDPPPHLR